MPYILEDDRFEELEIVLDNKDFYVSRNEIGGLVGEACRNGGDLQYILAEAIQTYLEKNGSRYQNCQDIMGALSGAQSEFYRCVVAPYEDEKIAENGAVYDREALKQEGY